VDSGSRHGAHECSETPHAGPFKVAEQVGRAHRRVAFLGGEPDDGRGDFLAELAEYLAQVGVRVCNRDPVFGERGGGEVGQIARDDVGGPSCDGGCPGDPADREAI
jgi:hypothetical protein